MSGVIYHKLAKVKGMYEATFGIKFPEIASLTQAVFKRHDFVHRSGKNKEGKNHDLETQEITALCDEIVEFVDKINYQLAFLNTKS